MRKKPTTTKYDCGNCGTITELAKEFHELEDLDQRLDPGSEVPVGECECGALAYYMPKPVPRMKHYAVVGRIPHDEEDSCYVMQTDSREKAVKTFEKLIYKDSDRKRSAVLKHCGDTIYINHVLLSEKPITIETGGNIPIR